MNVQLYTQSGGFVAEVEIIPLLIPAEIVVWGTRSFIRQDDGTYREGIAVPGVQANSQPTTGYLGGIKNEDGF